MSIAAIVFIAVFALVFGAYWLAVVIPESRGQSKLKRRLLREDPVTDNSATLLKRPEVLSSIAVLNGLLAGTGNWSGPLKRLLDQSGLKMTVGSFLLATLSSGFISFLLVNNITRLWWLAAGVGVFAGSVPFFVVRHMRQRRIRQFEDQFPEAIELI